MRNFFKDLLSSDIAPLARARLLVALAAFALMAGITIASQIQFSAKPLQVRELAGKQVSMEKFADIFLGMDQMVMHSHYQLLWVSNAVIFMGALLLLCALKDGSRK
jgi:hypothetical protein